MTTSDATPATSTTTINNTQVNMIGQDNADDALRRLAFALAKLEHQAPLLDAAAGDAQGEEAIQPNSPPRPF
jgi:hypothetical protein